jgi:hypothetical protein
VAALARDSRVQAWECSHLGGDRFAANVLALPAGRLFGGLAESDMPGLVDAVLEGRVALEHYRGQCGVPQAEQAVHWFALRALTEDRPGRVVVESLVHHGPSSTAGTSEASVDRFVAVVRHGVHRHDVVLTARWSEPARRTCRAPSDACVRQFALESLSRRP